jgi:saccharopine dehydrogenase (NADP+, L-glutamate forming)
MEEGKIKILPYNKVFERTWTVEVDGIGALEAYPNRDSLVYQKIFQLQYVDTMIRGTLRYPGWSETWNQIVKLGIPSDHLTLPDISGMSYREFTEMFLPLNANGAKLEGRLANYLGISPTGSIMKNLKWLGLFSEEKIEKKYKTSVDLMVDILKKKMPLPENSRDMVILLHEIIAEYPQNQNKEKITSTFVHFGEPNKYTAIAKTVGAPAAIAAKLILTNNLPLTGCHIPTHPMVYSKVIPELETLGIKFAERKEIM